MGRDLLAQDYILKQLTASLIYPEKDLGKEFWGKVYAKAQQLYGTTQIPVNTFNKVWILADQATVYEHGQTAFIIDGHLKVMLDEDYLAKQKHQATQASSVSSQVVREVVLPEIEREVNTGKNFAMLRQIFYSQILATWYKKNLKEALLNQVYSDKSTVEGVNVNDPSVKEKIYQQYLKAYKKGVFNYIKEDAQGDGQMIPRKYFSGGYDTNPAMLTTITAPTPQTLAVFEGLSGDSLFTLSTNAQLGQFNQGQGGEGLEDLESDLGRELRSYPSTRPVVVKYNDKLLLPYRSRNKGGNLAHRIIEALKGTLGKSRSGNFAFKVDRKADKYGSSLEIYIFDAAMTREQRSLSRQLSSDLNVEEGGGRIGSLGRLRSGSLGESDEAGGAGNSIQGRRKIRAPDMTTPRWQRNQTVVADEAMMISKATLNAYIQALKGKDPNVLKASRESFIREMKSAGLFKSTASRFINNTIGFASGGHIDAIEEQKQFELYWARLASQGAVKISAVTQYVVVGSVAKSTLPEAEVEKLIGNGVLEEVPGNPRWVRLNRKGGEPASRPEGMKEEIWHILQRSFFIPKNFIIESGGKRYRVAMNTSAIQEAQIYKDVMSLSYFVDGLNQRGGEVSNDTQFRVVVNNSEQPFVIEHALSNIFIPASMAPSEVNELMRHWFGGLEHWTKDEVENSTNAAMAPEAVDRASTSNMFEDPVEASFVEAEFILNQLMFPGVKLMRDFKEEDTDALKAQAQELLTSTVRTGVAQLLADYIGREGINWQNSDVRREIQELLFILREKIFSTEAHRPIATFNKEIAALEEVRNFLYQAVENNILSERVAIIDSAREALGKINNGPARSLGAFLKENESLTAPGVWQHIERSLGEISQNIHGVHRAALRRYREQQTDRAMTRGGIDLNTSSGMQWKVSKDGLGVEMNVDPATIERVKREGIDSLSPVIFKITPVSSVWPLVGLQAPVQ